MRKLSLSKMLLIVSVFCAATTIAASAQTISTLVDFDGTDGYQPGSALAQSTDGNLYGVTYYGGTPTSCPLSGGYNCGTVFKMTPAGELTTLYSFCTQPKCSDGANPASLIQASNGNFYGTTFTGGASTTYCSGCGTIFEITPSGNLTTLHTFCLQAGCPDGEEPLDLIQANDGNFYGVASLGGTYHNGTIFELTAAGKFKTLYNFCAQTNCSDGGLPVSLMQASDGNLYGTTYYSGAYNGGTLFQMTPAGKLTTLFSLHKPNSLIQGSDGSLYGTTGAGGKADHGIVFRLSPAGKLITLHSFCGLNCATGDSPVSGVVEGSDGNLYGTAGLAGLTYYAGALFEITSSGTFNTLYLFCSQSNCEDGWGPGALMQATNGTFYGTTEGGGTSNHGTVYTLSEGLGPFVAARPSFGSAGQSITILGNNLTGATSVTFNGTPATFTVVSDTYIQATVPAGATTGSIQVTTTNGTLSSNLPFRIP
ncbi:MAG: choice-of-anchor tandem repeat GloVer-containing protein [Candidatus Sulfotelmatobacter sp.]